jgi:hypothetical protein
MIETIISSILIGAVVFFLSYFYLGYRFENIYRKIAAAGALSPETAVKLEEVGITGEWDKRAAKRLVKEGKLRMTKDGRYYVIR